MHIRQPVKASVSGAPRFPKDADGLYTLGYTVTTEKFHSQSRLVYIDLELLGVPEANSLIFPGLSE